MFFDGQLMLSAGLLTTLTVNALKQAIRKFVVKDELYEFPDYFYKVTLPFFTAVWSIGLMEIGWIPKVNVVDPQSLLQWGLTVVVTLVLYHGGIQPYRSVMKAKKAKEAKDKELSETLIFA